MTEKHILRVTEDCVLASFTLLTHRFDFCSGKRLQEEHPFVLNIQDPYLHLSVRYKEPKEFNFEITACLFQGLVQPGLPRSLCGRLGNINSKKVKY